MIWNKIVGQDRVKTILRRSFTTKKIPHSYLFYGPEGTGKDACAFVFAALLNCEGPSGAEPCGRCSNCRRVESLQHPNLKLIIPLPAGKSEKEGDEPMKGFDESTLERVRREIAEKALNPYYRITIPQANAIKINSIREIRRSLFLASAEKGIKVIVISDAHRMNESSMNSLLKTLEEPAPGTVIILTTSHHDKLKPTIISRCQLVRFESLRESEIREGLIGRDPTLDEGQASLISKMANGSFSRGLELTGTDLMAQREEVIDLLRNMTSRTPGVWMKEIESFIRSKEKYNVVRSLMLLNLWLRDALMLRHGNTDGVINIDQRESLDKFVSYFVKSDLYGAIVAVERAIALVEKNIYLSLVFVNLAFEIRQNIKR